MTPFHIGQEVVCIYDTSDCEGPYQEILPVKGLTYTIRTIETSAHAFGVALRFCEIVNEPHAYNERITECRFWSAHFRPVIKTDISMLEALLVPAAKVPA